MPPFLQQNPQSERRRGFVCPQGPVTWTCPVQSQGPLSHLLLPPLGVGIAEKASTHAKQVPKPALARILTPHTCQEGSAPDLEGEDTTEQEATYIPQIPGEEIKGSPLTLG